MSEYAEFFLNSKSSVVQLETLEITHPDFTKDYRVVRNATAGLTVTLENAEVVEFDYYPLRVVGTGTRDNLDFGLKIDLGDLGEVLPTELDAVSDAGGFAVKPTIIYRSYRSDDLLKPLFGPLVLQVSTFSFNRYGSSFEARAPSLNVNKTGEVYSLESFPMLRAFL